MELSKIGVPSRNAASFYSIFDNSLFIIDSLSMDKTIKPHATALSTGGQVWLKANLETGNFIMLEMFPNEPTPTQFIVRLSSASGKTEKTAMISDVSGRMTSVFDSIVRSGDLVWLKT